MPAWLITLIKFAISYFGPTALSWLKDKLVQKFPDWAQVIEDLIRDLSSPSKSNSAARKKALKAHAALCTVGCAPELKNEEN